MSKRFTITAALPYTNGPIHIGHLAGVYIPADIYARYQRQIGNDVAFICGSDEHGVPITIKLKKKVTPQDIVVNITLLSKLLLKNLVSLSTTIQELQHKSIIKQLQIFLKPFIIKMNLLKKLQNNYMMLRQSNFLQIVL